MKREKKKTSLLSLIVIFVHPCFVFRLLFWKKKPFLLCWAHRASAVLFLLCVSYFYCCFLFPRTVFTSLLWPSFSRIIPSL